MSVNAVHDPYQRRPRAIAHADVLAGTVGLDMAKAGWTATGDSYLGRVTKARILEAVREAKGEDAADRITGLKKSEMVTAAEDLLVGTGWLPEPLRTPPLPEEDAPEIELVDEADRTDDELRKTIPTAAKRNRRKTAANRLSEIPTLRGKMIPSPVTPSPRQPPSDLRAARDLPPRSKVRGPSVMAGP
jgi:hypothetical protein